MALWQVAFQGTTPVGGPVIGAIIALTDPRIGLAVGGASCFAAAIGGAGLARRHRLAAVAKTARLERPAPADPVAAETPVGRGRTIYPASGRPARAPDGARQRSHLRRWYRSLSSFGSPAHSVHQQPDVTVGDLLRA